MKPSTIRYDWGKSAAELQAELPSWTCPTCGAAAESLLLDLDDGRTAIQPNWPDGPIEILQGDPRRILIWTCRAGHQQHEREYGAPILDELRGEPGMTRAEIDRIAKAAGMPAQMIYPEGGSRLATLFDVLADQLPRRDQQN